MSRTEFIIATAIVLFVAFCLGWFFHWLVHRFSRVAQSDMGELDTMAQQLHEAEEERDRAVAEYHAKEAEITNRMNQTQAELAAAMDGLRVARQEAEELREYVERMNAGD
jgi:ubiquinone biosynthesis protein UbiJ